MTHPARNAHEAFTERPSYITVELVLPPPSPLIVEITDAFTTRVVALSSAPIVVGTSPRADVVVTDVTVSRMHCELRLVGAAVELRDLGSRNGTFAGGARVSSATGNAGTVFVVGRTTLTVCASESSMRELAHEKPLRGVAGVSLAMRRVARDVRRFARLSQPVLVLGETGCGKELIARALHEESSRTGELVPINVASLPRELVESELFGHERGAFTNAMSRRRGAFDIAADGTLFLDEIGELPREAQPKLLRALDGYALRRVGEDGAGRQSSARVIAATHVDLPQAVEAGRFREDLYHRLSVLVVRLPPLRDRKSDLEAIATELLRTQGAFRGRVLTSEALATLVAYDWPGNVRELRNVLVRATAEEPEAVEVHAPAIARALHDPGASTATSHTRHALSVYAAQALLSEHRGNYSRAAEAAGLPRTTFRRLADGPNESNGGIRSRRS